MKNYITLIIGFVLLSCTNDKSIDIRIKTNFAEQTYIEGVLYAGETPQIYINRAVPFFDQKVTPQDVFARGANVRLSGPSGEEILSEDSIFDKFRCRWVPFYSGNNISQAGETYDLSVTYKGQTHTASTTLDQSKISIESVEHIAEFFDVYGGHDGVIVKFNDVIGEGDYYRFQMNRMIHDTVNHASDLDVLTVSCVDEGELIPVEDLGRTMYSDENIDGNQIEMIVEVSYEYNRGDTAYVMVQTLDPVAAAFYQELDEQLLSLVNPFIEPVFLKSNVDGALGVFGAGIKSDSVLFIYPEAG